MSPCFSFVSCSLLLCSLVNYLSCPFSFPVFWYDFYFLSFYFLICFFGRGFFCFCVVFFFFCKQNTAYEMRISDWSSDVCSSDLGLHAPVHEAHAQLGQRLRQQFERALRGRRDDLLGLVDDRAHPVRLATFGARRADAFDQLRAPLRAQHHGLHRGAAGRQLVDGGHVEVGVRRHRQRARDEIGRAHV